MKFKIQKIEKNENIARIYYKNQGCVEFPISIAWRHFSLFPLFWRYLKPLVQPTANNFFFNK